MQSGGVCCRVGVCATCAEEINERKLHTALPGHASRGHKHKGLVAGSGFRPGVENDTCHLNDVGRQRAVANRVLRDKLKQGRIAKVVAAFKENVLVDQLRM